MSSETKPEVEHRQVTYRVLFDRPATARRLVAVACRFVWNRKLGRQQQLFDDARLNGATPSAPDFFALGREFTRLRRTTRRAAMVRRHRHHRTSRKLANAAGTIVIEDLKTSRMTRSAKGTAEKPEHNVKAKAGLNRAILAAGWGNLRRMPEYKVLRVIAVDPRHISRTCVPGGRVDARSRCARFFACVACGHADHADLNAVRNIRRRGPALLHGEERSVLLTPATRETDRRLAA